MGAAFLFSKEDPESKAHRPQEVDIISCGLSGASEFGETISALIEHGITGEHTEIVTLPVLIPMERNACIDMAGNRKKLRG